MLQTTGATLITLIEITIFASFLAIGKGAADALTLILTPVISFLWRLRAAIDTGGRVAGSSVIIIAIAAASAAFTQRAADAGVLIGTPRISG